MHYQKYQLRLHTNYRTKDNDIETMKAEVFANNEWQPFSPDTLSPGFLLLVFALFSCQHRYAKTNCAERNLVLSSSTGEMELLASTDWNIKSFHVKFKLKLKDGTPNQDDIDYIRERMKHCPVSTNLSKNISATNEIHFEAA